MYQIGELVVYGMHGVCRVLDLEKQLVDRKQITYLVLEPLNQEGARYLVPTHNQAAMAKIRPMLSAQELDALLNDPLIRADGWIRDENQRKQYYRELITSGDPGKLLQMIHALYRHKETQTQAGRKVHLADDNFLRDAEKLLSSEISVIMNLPPEEARHYLRSRLKK